MALIEDDAVAAVAATVAVLSPRARKLMRTGAVYGIAGVLKAGDVVTSAARGAVRGARATTSSEAPAAEPGPAAKQPPSRSAPSRGGRARSGARATGPTS